MLKTPEVSPTLLSNPSHSLPSINDSDKNDPEKLREVAGQFEALFIQMMLKSMRSAGMGEGILDNNHSKTYLEMYDKEIATEISNGKGIGLADSLVQQLSGRPLVNTSSHSLPIIPITETEVLENQAANIVSQTKQPEQWTPKTPAEFTNTLWPYAQSAAEQLNTTPEVLIAQSALETGWGKSMIQNADGSNSFNLFGIKANNWDGKVAASNTLEYESDAFQKRRENFRSYDSLEASFNDYVKFLKSNPRYSEVLQSNGDSEHYTNALQKAGYATDPSYSQKIQRIINGPVLQSPTISLKVEQSAPIS